MADKALTVVADEDKDLVPEYFEETLYFALEPIKVALDRIFWHHQADKEVLGSIMVLERLVMAAEARLEAFDKGVDEHLGRVALVHKRMQYVGIDRREYVGARFTPKTTEADAPTTEAA